MNCKRLFLALLVAATVALGGCATNPYEGEGKTKSDALLDMQMQLADKQRGDKTEGQIIFAGFAMNSTSKAFRSDVTSAEKFILSINPNAIIFKLDNPAWGQSTIWPYSTMENMALVLAKVTALARPQDKVVILMTTHGNVDLLSINFSEKYYPSVDSKWINRNLNGLRGKPTLLLLSACYSGSFIDPLAGPSRIILTASAKDRSSFGCQFQSTNTYFIDSLLNQPTFLDSSIVQLMNTAKLEVDKREKEQKLTPPSLPQMSIGRAARDWASQPLKDWLKP
jgi:Peptidase C13 family